jgi:succinate-acetate transporter protein
MQEKFPGAASLGYAALFVMLWILFMPFAGWISFDSLAVLTPVMMLLSVALTIAGIFSFWGESKIEPVLFLIIAATIFSFSLRFVMFPALEANTQPAAADGWHLLLIAVIIFLLWMGSMKGNNIRQVFLLLLWIAFLAGALANWLGLGVLSYISGYVGLISALLSGWYLASMFLPAKETSE